jgi:hypothetical protein
MSGVDGNAADLAELLLLSCGRERARCERASAGWINVHPEVVLLDVGRYRVLLRKVLVGASRQDRRTLTLRQVSQSH